MALTLNLEKAKPALKLSLEKAGIFELPSIDVGITMDVSGSFDDEHQDGVTTDLLTRLAPYGLMMDPDKKAEVFTFSNGPQSAHYVGDLTEQNYQGYVRNKIIGKVPGYNGLTDYSYVLELFLKHFGWIPTEAKKAGFFGRMMGKKDEGGKAKKRSVNFFITDGANYDAPRTTQILQESQDRGDQVYFIFIGISNSGGRFPYLEDLGTQFGNTGFRQIRNIKEFVQMSDADLNDFFFDEEFTKWLKKTA